MDAIIEFEPSELGTKKHWDETYKQELSEFKKNHRFGDIWFGESNTLRVIAWMKNSPHLNANSSILDIGSGNGMTLSYLADEGFANLYGVDYIENAVILAQEISKLRDTKFSCEVGDILNPNSKSGLLSQKYDVCHDKGTYDAISLCPSDAKGKRLTYIENVSNLLKDGGLLIITSCNWTEHELLYQFQQYFEKFQTIPTAVFQFGGCTGSDVTSLILRKKTDAQNNSSS